MFQFLFFCFQFLCAIKELGKQLHWMVKSWAFELLDINVIPYYLLGIGTTTLISLCSISWSSNNALDIFDVL